ncbi:TfuA-like protein [Paracoccus sp. NGMCC 1.201697]|uniref:TfuA-like protein n=1 Tax=Paracoccus broussonetiae subsp. drimophilus TaxID=3373869 RepID=A0ABW7LJ30_9RHOB
MTAVIFAGPSLRTLDSAAFPDFTFLPPVTQGDLYAAALCQPAAIGIIDGFFDGQPAVWHKEILWAMSRGIAVFGAASMGALRAAELAPFGMVGVGRIFQDYRDSRLCDDDEVALVHGPAETGYVGLSEPMVNIRATVERAVNEGIIAATEAEVLLATAKSRFYPQRNWDAILGDLPDLRARDEFAHWLRHGRTDQKRQDALALLQAVRDHLNVGDQISDPPFHFEWTEAWANAPWQSRLDDADADAVLNELRLDPEAYLRTRDAALLQELAQRAADRAGATPDETAIARATRDFRLSRGFLRQSDLDAWISRNDMDRTDFDRLMNARVALDNAGGNHSGLAAAMVDQLRMTGRYVALRDRAESKRQAPTLEMAAVLPQPMLMSWYFETRLKRSYPDNIAEYAAELGFPGLEELHRFVAAEYGFLQSCDADVPETLVNANKRSTAFD